MFVKELHGGLFRAAKGDISHVDSAGLSSDGGVDSHGHGNVGGARKLVGRRLVHQRVDGYGVRLKAGEVSRGMGEGGIKGTRQEGKSYS